jgi:ParB/RepB/Spo0J family partition protein
MLQTSQTKGAATKGSSTHTVTMKVNPEVRNTMSKQSGSKQSYLPHALAEVVPGGLDGEEFQALCTSIKEEGLNHPIVLFEERILDGRERYRACIKVGVEPTFKDFKGKDPEAYVIANNLHRRQLNSMQKALVAARMCSRKENTLTQKAAAERCGVGVATVNLAVRLLDSKNTLLIKRSERGEASRGEIDELLYDRAATQQAQQRVSVAAAVASAEVDDEDLLGDVDTDETTGKTKTSGTVVDITDRLPTVGTKPSRAGKVAVETPASRVVQAFKGLTEAERKHFVDMAWAWLEPAIKAAGKPAKGKSKVA